MGGTMLWLALKTLTQEKGRLLLTLLGITFSTVLTVVEVSMYLGMMGNATGMVRHTAGDIWVVSKNVPNFDFSQPFPAHYINRIRALEAVLWAEKIHVWFGFLKLADGRREQAQVIGFNPNTGVGQPWAMLLGSPHEVKGGRYMIIDKTSEQRLGTLTLGSLWELTLFTKQSFKLVGLSQGIKSFTTIPMIFVSYNEIDRLLLGTEWEAQTSYIVVKLQDPSTVQEVVSTLQAALPTNDVYSKEAFIQRTVQYWTVQTGIGMAFFLTAVLAILIGAAIVGQTIYAGTMEHLRDYGTLKAMGARNRDINVIIFTQTALSASVGYGIGVLITFMVQGGIAAVGVPIHVHPTLLVGLMVVVVLTCLAAASFSVRKVKTLDPVMVFKE